MGLNPYAAFVLSVRGFMFSLFHGLGSKSSSMDKTLQYILIEHDSFNQGLFGLGGGTVCAVVSALLVYPRITCSISIRNH